MPPYHLEVVRALIQASGEALLLITRKSRVLKIIEDGRSCSFTACQKGHLEVARALIQAGEEAILLKTAVDGCSCLHIACQNGHSEVVQTLITSVPIFSKIRPYFSN